MADEIALGPQPNFNIIATEILKIPNTPALAGGQQLLAELRALREQSASDTMAIRQDLANIRQEIADTRQELMTMIVDNRQELITIITTSYVQFD
jgi:hypothetical protein